MPLTKRTRKRFLDCKGMTLEEAEQYGELIAEMARDCLFWMGDLARYCEARYPDTQFQAWPDWQTPEQLARTAGVCRAYPNEEDRQEEATYTIYMRHANRPNRIELVAAAVDAGRTSDEDRAAHAAQPPGERKWLLAFDVHYFVHRHYFSGAGVETAMQVSEWIRRTVDRLREKGASDVLCAFEGRGSKRRELVEQAAWEERYKDRPPKPSDLTHQLQLVRELLEGFGFCCCSIDGWEADDVLASAAAQFPAKTTIVTSDKDLRQCLSDSTNILLDVEWIEDPTSGDHLPEYKWLSAKEHTETTGIAPSQWCDYQAIMGDNVDGIKGCPGIGQKGAADLIQEFGSAEGAIAAAKAEDEGIRPKKRESLIEFEEKLEITRQLVTLNAELEIPKNTRI